MNKVTVILGAGASADCVGGSRINDEDWKPPLAKDLFDDLQSKPHIWEILQRYPAASVIHQELWGASKRAVLDLERELDTFAVAKDIDRQLAFKHVVAYLRDYLAKVSRSYTEEAGNYFRLVWQLLKAVPHEIMFIVLNYDTLLEQILERVPFKRQFSAINQYMLPGCPANVFKIHGSVNWVTEMGKAADSNWNDEVEKLDIWDAQASRVVVNKPGSIRDMTYNGSLVYPMLTAPLADKSVMRPVYAKSDLIQLETFLRDCKKYLVIGTSFHEPHLAEILGESAAKPTVVHIVNQGDTVPVLNRWYAAGPQFRIGAFAFTNGFTEYLLSEEFDRFVRTNPRE